MIVLLVGASRALALAGAPAGVGLRAGAAVADARRRRFAAASRRRPGWPRRGRGKRRPQATVSSREARARCRRSRRRRRTCARITSSQFGFVPPSRRHVTSIFPDIPNNYRVRAEVTVPVYTAGRVGALVDAGRGRRARRRRRSDATRSGRPARRRARLLGARHGARSGTRARRSRSSAPTRRSATCKPRVDAGVLPPNDLLSAQAQRAREAVQLIQARNARRGRRDRTRAADRRAIRASRSCRRPPSISRLPAPRTSSRRSRSRRCSRARASSAPSAPSLTERQASLRAPARPPLAARGRRWRALVGRRAGAAEPALRAADRRMEDVVGPRRARAPGRCSTAAGRARTAPRPLAQAEARRRIGWRTSTPRWRVEVRQRLLDLESSRAALAASAEAVAAATEARRVVEERFDAGVATSTDVLDAQLALLEAELERTRLPAALRLERGAAAARPSEAGEWRPTRVIRVEHLSRTLRHVPRGRRCQLRRAPRRGVRVSRQQRRRQVHDDPHAVRAADADRPARASIDGIDVGRDPERRQAAHRLHVAAVLALRAADRRSEHPLLRADCTGSTGERLERAAQVRARDGRPGRTRAASSRAICPAAGASGWRSDARCCTSRRSSFSTSRPAASIPSRAASSGG